MKPMSTLQRRGMLALALACLLAGASSSALAGDNGDARHLLYVPSHSAQVDHAANIRAFEERGFSVTTLSPAGESAHEYALRIRDEVRGMLARGVAPQAITVVGAGQGTPLVALASSAAGNRYVNYVLLGGCDARLADMPGFHLSGRVLGLRDAEAAGSGSCRPLFRDAPRLGHRRDLVVQSGHGVALFDAPREAWLQPLDAWSSAGRVDLGRVRVAATAD